MVKSRDVRNVIISHYKNGEKLQKLRHCLNIKCIKVHLIVGYIVTNNPVQFVLKKSGRPRTGHTKNPTYLVKKRVDSNIFGKSLPMIAKDFKCSHQTVKRVLNIDLKKKCYQKVAVQSLKEDEKPIRKTCCQ